MTPTHVFIDNESVVQYLKSNGQSEQNAADTHERVSSSNEDLPSQMFNEQTL